MSEYSQIQVEPQRGILVQTPCDTGSEVPTRRIGQRCGYTAQGSDTACVGISRPFTGSIRGTWKQGGLKLRFHPIGEAEESGWDHLAETLSAPFEAGEYGPVAVKVIDDRGNERLVVKSLKEAEG